MTQEKTHRMGLHWSGIVVTVLDMEITRRNRKTKTLITLYGEGGQWFTICEDHGAASEHYTKTAAIEWMADPAVWCQACAEAVA